MPVSSPTSFGEDSCGRVYITTFGGEISRLTGSPPAVCAVLRVAIAGGGYGTVTGTVKDVEKKKIVTVKKVTYD